MFVTSPPFEMPVPREIFGGGLKCWRALDISYNGPWFLMTRAVADTRSNEAFERTMLLWMGADVAQILSAKSTKIVALDYVLPPAFSETGKWQIRQVRTVWRVKDDSTDPCEFLVFADSEGKEFRETSDGALTEGSSVRELVASFG